MRIRLPFGRAVFFGCMLLIALVALLPMRLGLDWLGLDESGVAARETRGSIWNGVLLDAQMGGSDLGAVEAGLNMLPLLIGKARISVSREDATGDGHDILEGAISVSGGDLGLDDFYAHFPVDTLFAPLPIRSLSLDNVTVHFESDLCVSAEGLVRAEVQGDLGAIGLPSSLAGNARCDEGALLLPLSSQSGMEALNLRIGADGRYRSELLIRTEDAAMRERLVGAGFQLGRGGYALVTEGQL